MLPASSESILAYHKPKGESEDNRGLMRRLDLAAYSSGSNLIVNALK